MRSKTAAMGMMRYLLLGLGVGIFILLGLFLLNFLQPDQTEEAQRIRDGQARVQEITPAPTPRSSAQ
ncbi:hypothetical protein [Aureimonas sp. Leaf324]|jgi:hypothetical protein|uniref:hypothetical protein n=1 Tax=Aureimonas sp. Leaf324 TaxID=1736336 RepID=UPI0006F3C396|nr:hypothetical protein [Aureimonas sp. Leaf324]KQQ81562.1 hypothetical protein ASF65_20635 [Aureimonas sp. Leaf324]